MKVVYVAGPFRAPTPWQVEQNVRRAEVIALNVWKVGAVALCPHLNTRLFDKEAPDPVWLAGAMELLRRSDAILMIPGWEGSSGSIAELAEARRLGLTVLYSVEELCLWLITWQVPS